MMIGGRELIVTGAVERLAEAIYPKESRQLGLNEVTDMEDKCQDWV